MIVILRVLLQCHSLYPRALAGTTVPWRFKCFIVRILFPYWPGGLQITNEQKEDSYHFLVFTDVLGSRTHGVVVQYYRPILVQLLLMVQNYTPVQVQKPSPPLLTVCDGSVKLLSHWLFGVRRAGSRTANVRPPSPACTLLTQCVSSLSTPTTTL